MIFSAAEPYSVYSYKRAIESPAETQRYCVVRIRDFAKIYERDVLSTWGTNTQKRSKSLLKVHLNPEFGDLMLREITVERAQNYFARFQRTSLSAESLDKIRDVMSAVLGAAVDFNRLVTNPVAKIRLKKRRLNKPTPFLRIGEFYSLLDSLAEPYATMVSVDEHVIERIYALKSKEVVVRAGLALRHYRVVKSDRPEDLVFQSVKTGAPMSDNTILSRHIKPAGRKLGIGWVNWQVLRRSNATWLQQSGVDMKDAQGLLSHSRAVDRLSAYVQRSGAVQ